MIVKVYYLIWTAVILSAIALMTLGAFSNIVAVVYGFVAFGLTFMGMIGLLPEIVSHPEPAKKSVAKALKAEPASTRRGGPHVLKSA